MINSGVARVWPGCGQGVAECVWLKPYWWSFVAFRLKLKQYEIQSGLIIINPRPWVEGQFACLSVYTTQLLFKQDYPKIKISYRSETLDEDGKFL